MKKKVYIIDLIGNHSGMHYYHSSFLRLFENESKIQINILSNYDQSNKKAFFFNIFDNNIIINVSKLIWSFVKLLVFILFKRKSNFIYLSYGCLFDIPFLLLSSIYGNRFIIDIHEIYDLADTPSNFIKKIFNLIFKKLIKKSIIHSEKNIKRLNEIGYKGKIIFVPHFRYDEKINSKNNINLKVKSLFIKDKINIVFFGHIRLSKGIDLLYEYLNGISNIKILDKLNFIIAGNDTDNLIAKKKMIFNTDISNNILLRRLDDDELEYIFIHADYLILPYKEISQSGIIEMAIKYKKPMLLSDIPEFVSYLNRHPSFGHVFLDSKDFEKTLLRIQSEKHNYYNENDLTNYYTESSFLNFKEEFLKILF